MTKKLAILFLSTSLVFAGVPMTRAQGIPDEPLDPPLTTLEKAQKVMNFLTNDGKFKYWWVAVPAAVAQGSAAYAIGQDRKQNLRWFFDEAQNQLWIKKVAKKKGRINVLEADDVLHDPWEFKVTYEILDKNGEPKAPPTTTMIRSKAAGDYWVKTSAEASRFLKVGTVATMILGILMVAQALYENGLLFDGPSYTVDGDNVQVERLRQLFAYDLSKMNPKDARTVPPAMMALLNDPGVRKDIAKANEARVAIEKEMTLAFTPPVAQETTYLD